MLFVFTLQDDQLEDEAVPEQTFEAIASSIFLLCNVKLRLCCFDTQMTLRSCPFQPEVHIPARGSEHRSTRHGPPIDRETGDVMTSRKTSRLFKHHQVFFSDHPESWFSSKHVQTIQTMVCDVLYMELFPALTTPVNTKCQQADLSQASAPSEEREVVSRSRFGWPVARRQQVMRFLETQESEVRSFFRLSSFRDLGGLCQLHCDAFGPAF